MELSGPRLRVESSTSWNGWVRERQPYQPSTWYGLLLFIPLRTQQTPSCCGSRYSSGPGGRQMRSSPWLACSLMPTIQVESHIPPGGHRGVGGWWGRGDGGGEERVAVEGSHCRTRSGLLARSPERSGLRSTGQQPSLPRLPFLGCWNFVGRGGGARLAPAAAAGSGGGGIGGGRGGQGRVDHWPPPPDCGL